MKMELRSVSLFRASVFIRDVVCVVGFLLVLGGWAQWGLSLAVGQTIGWRNNGESVFPDAAPGDLVADPPQIQWKFPMSSTSNASTVVSGNRVFVTGEPTTLLCLDAKTGKLLWRQEHPMRDFLSAKEQRVADEHLAAAEKAEGRLEKSRRELNRLERLARTQSPPSEVNRKIDSLRQQVTADETTILAAKHYLTPPDRGLIGYASATPVTDGHRVYALFGNGVIVAYDLAGKRLWGRWLGPAAEPMIGNQNGSASSPVLIGDTLVVGFGVLTALDVRTGAVRWRGRTYRHFGTPTPVKVGKEWAVALPDQTLVRLRDGRVFGEPAAPLLYQAPVLVGETLYLIGNRQREGISRPENVRARALRLPKKLVPGLQLKEIWDFPIFGGALSLMKNRIRQDQCYAAPVYKGGRLYGVTQSGWLLVLNANTGEVEHLASLPTHLSSVYANPVIVGDRLYVGTEDGHWMVVQTGPPFEVLATHKVGAHRATPFFIDDRVFLRIFDGVVALQ